MAEIKPCPNCNYTNTMRKVHILSARLPFWWYIECWIVIGVARQNYFFLEQLKVGIPSHAHQKKEVGRSE